MNLRQLQDVSIQRWEAMPSLESGHTDDLKYDDGRHRVWVSRMTLEDYGGDRRAWLSDLVVIEELRGGRWARIDAERGYARGARSKKVPYYSKQLGFPEVRDFRQLFTHVEPFVYSSGRDTSKVQEQERRLGVRIRGERDARDGCGYMVLGPYMSIDGPGGRRRSLAVKPAQNLVDWITVTMIFIDCDRLYFDVVVRDRGNALVTVKYNRIIGSRWIASIDPRTIPDFGD